MSDPPIPPQPWTTPVPAAPALARARRPANAGAAAVGAVSAGVLIAASFMRWSVVHFDGIVVRELSPSGWDGGDGKITVLIGIGAAIATVLIVGGVTERWLRLGLMVAGSVGLLDCVLAFLDATSSAKPAHVADTLGITATGIDADAGIGVVIAALAALGLVIAGLLLERPPSAP